MHAILKRPWKEVTAYGFYKGYIPGLKDDGKFKSKEHLTNFVN